MEREILFKEIADAVSSRVGEGMDVELQEIVKAGDNVLHGLIIKGRDEDMVPILYLEPLLEDFGEDLPPQILAEMIVKSYEELEQPPLDLNAMSWDFEDIKDKLEMRLVGMDMNRERLKDALYTPAGNGLAMVPYIVLEDGEDGIYQCMVTKGMAREQGYDPSTVFGYAMDNTIEKHPPILESIMGAVEQMGLEPIPGERGTYVLTTESPANGAIAMFYPGIQEKIGMQLGESYFVLPTSIHEMMVVGETECPGADYLQEVLREGNKTIVSPEDVLSNNVLRYDIRSQTLAKAVIREKPEAERGDM